jgi:uncharacterized protein YaaQ
MNSRMKILWSRFAFGLAVGGVVGSVAVIDLHRQDQALIQALKANNASLTRLSATLTQLKAGQQRMISDLDRSDDNSISAQLNRNTAEASAKLNEVIRQLNQPSPPQKKP